MNRFLGLVWVLLAGFQLAYGTFLLKFEEQNLSKIQNFQKKCKKVICAIFLIFTGVTIDIDVSRAPDLQDFGNRVKAALEDYYPRAVEILDSPTFQPIDRFVQNSKLIQIHSFQSQLNLNSR